MGINYLATKRMVGFENDKAEMYVVRAIGSGELTFDKLCTRVSTLCGAHRGVTKMIVACLVDTMIDGIEDGKTVSLGELGNFRASISAKAVADESDANASTIRRRKVIFTPGRACKEALKRTSITRYVAPDNDWTNGSSSGSGSGGSGGGSGSGDPNA